MHSLSSFHQRIARSEMTSSPNRTGQNRAESSRYRALPAVSAVLDALADRTIEPRFLTELIRQELERARTEIGAGGSVDRDEIIARCRERIDLLVGGRFAPAINATGIVLHTNLGRAPVSHATAAAMAAAAASYVPLELDPITNRRGGRMDEISTLLRILSGAEATLVVNNNAAAVLLTLTALCEGRDVIVSRGEAVEIGGGFRIPDVIAQSRCHLVEVGTTNRTYPSDFRSAAGASTAALLKVHTSNFRIEGFTADVASAELGELARELGVLSIEDLGSGALLDTGQFGLRREMTVAESIDAGTSVVLFSGDKLLGGPQAGVIAGNSDAIRRIEQHPLARAVRADKVTLAGIAATLRHYLRGEAEREIPIWRMIGTSRDALALRASELAARFDLAVARSNASIGGGSLPGETLPSVALRIDTEHADELARALRTGTPCVFPYIREGAVMLDLRTVLPDQDHALGSALARVLG